ncbi:MAG TPA: response regulator transcription factor, partial [Roseiflexaceae bacterium]|nr:response regulator transcription factor [Roseiflexaceae bacterium]
DIVVLDLDLGGESGMDLIPTLIATVPGVRILVLTGMRDGNIQRSAVQVGAVGLVEKDEVLATLVPAIRKVAQGQVWLDPALVASVLQEMVRARGASEPDADGLRISRLTERERDVIRLICQGLTNRVIAERLVISETTVRHHLTSIFSKLEVENRLERVIYAFRNGLATLD